MVYIYTQVLLGLGCLWMFILAGATSSLPSDPSVSPSADTELICPNDNAGDCYPRVFQPTKDFQIIKEGQDIPPGLHVRMNIWSGEKEARLNIPMEGEEGGPIEGIPEEQAMVVIAEPEEEEPVQEQSALRDRVPNQPPPYDPVGKIVPPVSHDGGEIGVFQKAMMVVGVEGRAFDSALDELSELSHDIYYGVEIAKNGPVLEKLVCLALGSGSEKFPANEDRRDHKAASILASTIQNNPAALAEVAKSWRLVMFPTCGMELIEPQTKQKMSFVGVLRGRVGRENNPATLKAKVGAISGLLKEPLIRDEFLATGGMELLLAIWLKKGAEWDGVKRKVAQLVLDNFLDESMGAVPGVWPTRPVAEDRLCETKGRMLEDGCWEHHVENFSKVSPDASWVVDFLTALRDQRGKWGDSIQDREL